MTQWIDFKELRKSLDFRRVLEFYKVEITPKGKDQHRGFCPLPTHQSQNRTKSFSVHLERGVWRCFGCGAKGNVLDFAARMEGLDPAIPKNVREVAVLLHERFGPKEPPHSRKVNSQGSRSASNDEAKATMGDRLDMPRVANAPLDFTLKNLDPTHPYFKERGLTADTVAHFGLGYCAKGMMAGRIVIPIHDAAGKLVAYAGHLADETAISPENPEYKFPGDRVRKGVQHLFRKSLLLYNGHGLKTPLDELFVTQDFLSTWRLWQQGHTNVVSLMGSTCSPEQAGLITASMKANGKITVFTGGEQAGERCAVSVFTQVAGRCFVRRATSSGGKRLVGFDCGQLN